MRLAWFLVLALASGPALAHKPSDSYLALRTGGAVIEGQWDIALRDLEHAIGLDADGDGAITWGELRAQHPEIATYALARLTLNADGRACRLVAGEQLVDRHSDGAYSVLRFAAHCGAPARRTLAVGYRLSAVSTRMTRSAMLEVLREDYIRTARAKGLVEKLILSRHALKNAMLPVLTVVGLEFAFLMGGLVVTEQVFNLNGLGLLFVQAVAHRDYTLTQALVLLVASVFIVVNFLMDLMYAWLDPRIRFR